MRKRASVLAAILSSALAAPLAALESPGPGPEQSGRPAAPAPDAAAARAAALDRLFDVLREAPSPEIARGIEQVIWAIWLKSGNVEADRLVAQSMLAMSIRDYPLARHHLDAVIMLEPDFAEGWNKRATVYFLEGDYARSLADIDRVLSLEPRHFGALSGLGMIMERLDRKDEALDAFRRTLAISPQMPGLERKVEELAVEVEGQEL